MTELLAVPAPGTQAFLDVLRSAWEQGWAVLPLDPRLPPAARDDLVARLRPTLVVDGDHPTTQPRRTDDGVAALAGDLLVVPTSGSTGEPRGIVHTVGTLGAANLAVSRGLGVDAATDRWLCCLPVSHVAGLSIIGRSWLLEMRLELHDGFDPSAVESAARDRGATLISAVPAMLDRFDTSVFRVVLVGGSAMPARLPGNAVASYGMTEAAGAVCLDGRPIDGAEVRVTDGEVWIRGPMVGRAERFGDDPAGRRLVDEDGWLHTGDEGALDETGTLAVAGRRGDVIVTGGEKVWPGPVEQRLAEHAAIEAVAVVGRPDDRWGNAVTAVVVPADAARPPSLAELRSWVKETLPAYAAPQTLELTDDLPRTALGKIRRRPV